MSSSAIKEALLRELIALLEAEKKSSEQRVRGMRQSSMPPSMFEGDTVDKSMLVASRVEENGQVALVEQQIRDLEANIKTLHAMYPLLPQDTVESGALLEICFHPTGVPQSFFVLPVAGSRIIKGQNSVTTVITLDTPLVRALQGCRQGETRRMTLNNNRGVGSQHVEIRSVQ